MNYFMNPVRDIYLESLDGKLLTKYDEYNL